MRRLKWTVSSMRGCVVFFMLSFAVPMWAFAMNDLYDSGTLTMGRAVSTAALLMVLGAAIGVAMWFTAIKGLVEARKNKR